MVLIRGNLIDGDRQTTAKVEKVVRQKSPEKFTPPPRAKFAGTKRRVSAPVQSQGQGRVLPWTASPNKVLQKADSRDPSAANRRRWEESKKIAERNKAIQSEFNRNMLKRMSKPDYTPDVKKPIAAIARIAKWRQPQRDDQMSMRDHLLGSAPGGGGNIAHMGPDKDARDKAAYDKKVDEAKKKRIEESNKKFYAEQAKNRPGNGDNRELSWEDYEALSPTDRAAVDANSILMEAVEKDKGFISDLDQNNDGKVTSSEANAKGTYGKNYEALFGRSGGDVTYAPNTVAALRLLEQGGFTVDDGDSIDNFLNGGRYVTARDMDLGRTTTESKDKPSAVKITGSMAKLSKALEDGVAVINGQQGGSINLKYTTPEQRTKLVENIQADMLAGGSFEAAFNPEATGTPVSLGAVYDEGYAQRRSGYQWMMDRILEDSDATLDVKLNTLNSEEEIQRFASDIGIDFDMSEWTDLMKQRIQTEEE